MRYIGAILSTFILIVFIILLNKGWGSVPPLGKLLNPLDGFSSDQEITPLKGSTFLRFPEIEDSVDIYLDDRMVPHIFAQKEKDAYFALGYMHAKDRLWEMEFYTHLAGGRISEIVGEKGLQSDRAMRRLGMVYAAEILLDEITKDTLTKGILNAYTQGVNAYIKSLTIDNLPLEYKMLNYKPEAWTNLKSCLFTKLMTKDLAGYDEDFEKTYALATFGIEMYQLMYPIREDSLKPIIPNGFIGHLHPLKLHAQDTTSDYFHPSIPNDLSMEKPDKGNGSNNWAVSGTKTKSGRPILCNDPHLRLRLPAIWYEVQITTPQYSAYGVSFPGIPSIAIGFNDYISWGETNAMRDVMDYYKITYKNASEQEYLYNGKYLPVTERVEVYKVKNGVTFIDTVKYTHFGPVVYDKNFTGTSKTTPRTSSSQNFAVRWKAHDPSNELLAFNKITKAKNYAEFLEGVSHFECPGQSFVFASKSGDIAMIQQGVFPAKWRYQGEFVMDGKDSTYEWQGMIPNSLAMKNPERGYVYSANQLPADPNNYPYYLGGNYVYERGYRINQVLNSLRSYSVQDMKDLQNDNYNTGASMVLPLIFSTLDSLNLTSVSKGWVNKLKAWNLKNDAQEEGATVYDVLIAQLQKQVWGDELKKTYLKAAPELNTLIQALRKDINFICVDNINTPQKETFRDILKTTLDSSIIILDKAKSDDEILWGKYKKSGVPHILDLNGNMPALSRLNLNIGGGEGIVNAMKRDHGPSWRMIVHMTDEIEAYGVYPGGQSGHVGNPYYDNGVDIWSKGEYYRLWFMKPSEKNDQRIQAKLIFYQN